MALFAALDYVIDEVILIGGVVVGPLVASMRLGRRGTGWVAVIGMVLATVVVLTEPANDDTRQRIVILLIALLGSALAVYLARVREERERAAEWLAAQHAVARVGAEAATLEVAAPRMLRAIGEVLGWEMGALWELNAEGVAMRQVASWHAHDRTGTFDQLSEQSVFKRGEGLPGRVWDRGAPAWIEDIAADRNFPRGQAASADGLLSAFAFPTIAGDDVFGVMEFFSRSRRAPDAELLNLMATFGTQVGQYIEAKRAEQAVRESEAVKTAVLESALDCVVTMDGDGRIVDFNPAAERTFGYARSEAIGAELAELLIPPALRSAHKEGLRNFHRTGEGPVFGGRLELEGMRSDGTIFPVELTVQPIAGGAPPLFAGYLRDISARHEAEAALRRSRDELEATLGNLADGVMVLDSEGRLVYANQAAADTSGFPTPTELMASPPTEVLRRFELFDEQDEPISLDCLPGWRALRGEQPEPMLVRFRLRDTGAETWSVVKATPVRNEDGEVVRAVAIYEDISAQKRVEIGQRFLAQAGRLLGASLDYETTLRSVAQVAVPSFSDWCTVDLVTDDGLIARVGAAHSDPAKLELARELIERYPLDPDDDAGVPQVIRSGEAQLLAHLPDELLVERAHDEDHLRLMRSIGMHSAMVVPLPSWRGALGALTFGNSETPRRFDEHDLELAEEVGRRAATAIENARLYGERAYIARTLQNSLLPPHLPEIPGLEVAARYRAAGEGNEVGGDFYDLFDTGDARWAVVIGDVCGKGADAAAITALARYTLRAAAMRERRPSRVLEQLNEALLHQRDDRQFCTVAYATVDVGAQGAELTVSCGGHPAPVVVRRDGQVELAPCRGTLIGVVPDPELREAALSLSPGDALVFYTDGVTEARTEDGFFGVDRLAGVAAATAGLSAAEIARRIEEVAASGELRDDLAIVVLRVPDSSNGGRPAKELAGLLEEGELFSVRLPATREAIGSARRAVDALEEAVGAGRVDDLRLLVSELVTNGLRHGAPDPRDWIGLRVQRARNVLRVEVSDPGPGFDAKVRDAALDAADGWGLYLVDRLSASWGVEREDRTTVWFEMPTG